MIKGRAQNKWFSNFYVRYSALFVVLALCIFAPFIFAGRSLINDGDGYNQFFSAAVFFSEYLRGVGRAFLQTGTLTVPTWSNSVGLGQDIIQSLNYYVIGDPLNLVYAFVPARLMVYAFSLMSLLRLYLCGVAFKLFASRFSLPKNGVLIGALMYAFCAFAIGYGLKQVTFLNAMIYLPLLLLGAEHIMERKRPTLFIAMIALSGMSNFYFLFSNSLITLAYCLLRFIYLHAGARNRGLLFAATVLRFVVYYLIGVLLAAWLLLPVLIGLFSSARADVGFQGNIFLYSLITYIRMGEALFSNVVVTNSITLGLTVFGFMSALLLFFIPTRKARYLRAAVIIALIAFMTPLTSYVFNGMTHTKNRWAYAAVLVVAFVTAYAYDAYKQLTLKEKGVLTGATLVLGGAVFSLTFINPSFFTSRHLSLAAPLTILLISAVVLWLPRKARMVPAALSALCLVQIAAMGYTFFAPSHVNTFEDFVLARDVNNKRSSHRVGESLLNLDKNTADYRYSSYLESGRNYGLLTNTPASSASLSLQPKAIFEFSHTIGNAVVSNNSFFESFDNRAALTTLGNISYVMQNRESEDLVPYGFELIKKTNTGRAYRNAFALHKIYSYDKQLNLAEWNRLSQISKEQALLEGVLLQNAEGGGVNVLPEMVYAPNETPLLSQASFIRELKMAAEQTDEKQIAISAQKIVTTGDDVELTIPLEGRSLCENYIQMRNISFVPSAATDSGNDPEDAFNDNKKTTIVFVGVFGNGRQPDITAKKRVRVEGTSSDYYIGPQSLAVNLGYSDAPIKSVRIIFKEAGTYTFDGISAVAQPMEGYDAKIRALDAAHLSKLAIDGNVIAAQLDSPNERVAVMAVPYMRGWSVTVNGKPTPVYQANGMYIGFKVQPGRNVISCKYQTPGLRLGLIISGVTLVILSGYAVQRHKRMVKP